MDNAKQRYLAARRWFRELPNMRRERDGFYFNSSQEGATVSLNSERTPREVYAVLLRQGGYKKCRRFYVRRARAIRLNGFKTTDVRFSL